MAGQHWDEGCFWRTSFVLTFDESSVPSLVAKASGDDSRYSLLPFLLLPPLGCLFVWALQHTALCLGFSVLLCWTDTGTQYSQHLHHLTLGSAQKHVHGTHCFDKNTTYICILFFTLKVICIFGTEDVQAIHTIINTVF